MATKPKTPVEKWPFLGKPPIHVGITQTEIREYKSPLHKLFVEMNGVSKELRPKKKHERTVDLALRDAARQACCVLGVAVTRRRVSARYVQQALSIIEAVSPNRAPLWASVLENIFLTAPLLRLPLDASATDMILEKLRPVHGLPPSFLNPSPERMSAARRFVENTLLDGGRTRWMIATKGETAGGRTKLLSAWDATVGFASKFGYALPRKRDAERPWSKKKMR